MDEPSYHKDIVLLTPSVAEEDAYKVLSTYNFGMPEGLMALKAYIHRETSYSCQVVDAHSRRYKHGAVVSRLQAYKPKIIGITTNQVLVNSLERTLDTIKKVFSETPIVLGGPDATVHPEEWAEKADYVVRGEGEQTFKELSEYILSGKGSPENILGLTFKDKDGKLISNPDRPQIQHLDSLPFISLEDRMDYAQRNDGYRVMATRGCEYKICKFCHSGQIWPGPARARSAKNIFEEASMIYDEMPDITNIHFDDDSFLDFPDRWKELYDMLKEAGWDVDADFQARAPQILANEALLEQTKDKIAYVHIGIESMDADFLKRIKKGTTPEINKKAMEILDRLEIPYSIFMIPFDADSTLDEYVGTVRSMANPDYPLWPKLGQTANCYGYDRDTNYIEEMSTSFQTLNHCLHQFDEFLGSTKRVYGLLPVYETEEEQAISDFAKRSVVESVDEVMEDYIEIARLVDSGKVDFGGQKDELNGRSVTIITRELNDMIRAVTAEHLHRIVDIQDEVFERLGRLNSEE